MTLSVLPDHWTIRAKHGKKLVFKKKLWKQEGEFQKDKTDAKLPDHWASELSSIRGNMPK
jgi:hypothetical protein